MAETPMDHKQLREAAERAMTSGEQFGAATVLGLLDALDAAEVSVARMNALEQIESIQSGRGLGGVPWSTWGIMGRDPHYPDAARCNTVFHSVAALADAWRPKI